jgi:hypothetical protein
MSGRRHGTEPIVDWLRGRDQDCANGGSTDVAVAVAAYCLRPPMRSTTQTST